MRLGKAPTAFPLRRQLLPLLQFSTSGTDHPRKGKWYSKQCTNVRTKGYDTAAFHTVPIKAESPHKNGA